MQILILLFCLLMGCPISSGGYIISVADEIASHFIGSSSNIPSSNNYHNLGDRVLGIFPSLAQTESSQFKQKKLKSTNQTKKANNPKQIILSTKDNVKIAVNHYDSNKRDSVLIVCPGWYMCKDSYVFKNMSEDLFKNTDIISMDFRGHCKSSGSFTFTAREVNDLKAVVDYAKSRYSNVSLMGFSLGGATSIIYTAKYKDINSVIVVSAPSDFDKIEHHSFKKEAYMQTFEKFELWRAMSIRPGNIFLNKTKPVDVIQDISPTPILFITGTKDPTVYEWHTDTLYKKAGSPKAIEKFKDNFHAEDLYLQSHDRFIKTCTDWLNATFK
ncbi:MAG: hypothetical protein A2255_02200 [Candidatus Melainabacteria bacterium RIFOXYA2_FULL_32_9]|nr:MAG: hypothetical protein A2255_02200 [Candidatus Melainabacteria bacterium RIFOXYA2_FULL_32_9]